MIEEATGESPDHTGLDDLDFAVDLPGVGRFRGNAFRSRREWAVVLRHVRSEIPTVEGLGLPTIVQRWCEATSGLILVCGPTGSGKSTTLAAMVGHINAARACHILTIEDPVEFLHADRRASVSQREVHTDTAGFATALRSGLRQDPDVILIGEIRDAETMRIALHASESGHLVLATLHAGSALEAVHRVVNLFPADEQSVVRGILAEALIGVLCQRLVWSDARHRRQVVCEVMTGTPRTHDAIADAAKTAALPDIIADGDHYGMRTLMQDAALAVISGDLTVAEAESVVPPGSDLRVVLQRAGYRGADV
jgi:twitching motility protein PilT